MPTFNIVRQSTYKKTFRNESVKGQFELQIDTIVENFKGNVDIETKSWKIGLIVGASGTGKTTIAREIFGDNYITQHQFGNESVLDEMPAHCTTDEITRTFNSVGFATVWSWLKPYHVLSNGEKMRVDLAHAMLSQRELIVFDEFTSVVDRTVAKTASFAISKAIRKTGKQFVAVACHRDIIDWLEPDWVYDTDTNEFFFAQANTNDRQSNLKSENVQRRNGIVLKSIII